MRRKPFLAALTGLFGDKAPEHKAAPHLFAFIPIEDVTLHELAEIVQELSKNSVISRDRLNSLEPGVRRHFKRVA